MNNQLIQDIIESKSSGTNIMDAIVYGAVDLDMTEGVVVFAICQRRVEIWVARYDLSTEMICTPRDGVDVEPANTLCCAYDYQTVSQETSGDFYADEVVIAKFEYKRGVLWLAEQEDRTSIRLGISAIADPSSLFITTNGQGLYQIWRDREQFESMQSGKLIAPLSTNSQLSVAIENAETELNSLLSSTENC